LNHGSKGDQKMARPLTVDFFAGEPLAFQTEALLLAAVPDKGRIAYAVDTNKFFIHQGSSWYPMGGGLGDVEAVATGPNTLLANESGKIITNEGAAGAVTHNLPAAAAGLQFTFVVQAAQNMVIQSVGTDTIRSGAGVSSGPGTATSGTVGDTITLVAINATEWIATSEGDVSGAWVLA
jgi:hypothetical protein